MALEFNGNALTEILFKIKAFFENNKVFFIIIFLLIITILTKIKYEYAVEIPPIFTESLLSKKEILNEFDNKKLIQMNSIQNE